MNDDQGNPLEAFGYILIFIIIVSVLTEVLF